MGIQTLYDRYLLHHRGTRFEAPQFFWMRVAMGLALREKDREARFRNADEVLGFLSRKYYQGINAPTADITARLR